MQYPPDESDDRADDPADDRADEERWPDFDPADFDAVPIPEELWSAETGAPFAQCLVCRRTLEEAGFYQIQKAWRAGEVVLEMAVCEGCAAATGDECSEESNIVICRFLETLLMERHPGGHCQACGRVPASADGHTTVAMCSSRGMLEPRVTACHPCIDAMGQELSAATRSAYGEFIRDHFPGVPAGLDSSPMPML